MGQERMKSLTQLPMCQPEQLEAEAAVQGQETGGGEEPCRGHVVCSS